MNSQILTPLSYVLVWLLSHALLSCIQLISIGRSRPSSRLPAKIEFSGHSEGSYMFKAQGGAAKTNHSLANQTPSMIGLSCHLFWHRGSKSVSRKVYCSIHVITCLCCMHICLHHSCLWLKSFLGTDFGASWPCLRSYSTRWCQRASEWWTGSEDFGDIVVCSMSIHSIAFEG